MMSGRTKAFTLIELLVVVVIILILVAVMVPVLTKVWKGAEVVQCKNNMKQVGLWFVQEAVTNRMYHSGGSGRTGPGNWPDIHALLLTSLKTPKITHCASVKENSPLRANAWATCSYAYLGNAAVTYSCKCSTCGDNPGKQVWRFYWSGVDYKGDHGNTDAGGDLNGLKGLPLADNLVFLESSVDADEANTPTIPEHQDTDQFATGDVKKFRDIRALRALPVSPADHRSNQPILCDFAVYRTGNFTFTGAPTSSTTSWKATDLDDIITEQNKVGLLFANHCVTSATGKNGWGINVFYSSGNIAWKRWDELRFQVMARKVPSDDDKHHWYFF